MVADFPEETLPSDAVGLIIDAICHWLRGGFGNLISLKIQIHYHANIHDHHELINTSVL